MPRIVVAWLVALLACSSAPAPVARPLPVEPSGAPLLWRIEHLGRVSYLYGTIHTGGQTLVPEPAWAALAASRTLVLETDLTAMDPAVLEQRIFQPPGGSLERQLTPNAWKALVAALDGVLPPEQIDRCQPWYAAIILVQTFLPDGESVDALLKARAEAQGARLAYLETWQQQIDAIERGTGVADLELVLADLGKARSDMDELMRAYARGDVAALERLILSPDVLTASAREHLFDARNRAWMPGVEQALVEGGAFLAVGAGHLVGPASVIELLAQRGIVAVRVEGPSEVPATASSR
jgi:uncharacterized protein YbaP (TraB family)